MFTIYIGSEKARVHGESGGTFTFFPIVYEKDNKLHGLRRATDLPTLDGVEIYLVWWRFFIPLSIPKQLERAILNFMLFKHIIQDDSFDCYSFACEVAQVPQGEKRFLLDYWRLTPLRFWPKVGDVIFLSSPKFGSFFKFHHAAVYIGFGKYLSVWGAGGQLEVATLADMKNDFGVKDVYLASPK